MTSTEKTQDEAIMAAVPGAPTPRMAEPQRGGPAKALIPATLLAAGAGAALYLRKLKNERMSTAARVRRRVGMGRSPSIGDRVGRLRAAVGR